MVLPFLIFLGPGVAVCAIILAQEAAVWCLRAWQDRRSARLVRRYRRVTRVSLDPQACEQRRAPRELQRLREFYEQADRLEVDRRAAEGIYDYCRELGLFASTALEISQLPETRGGLWS